jgi:hypothetical protein
MSDSEDEQNGGGIMDTNVLISIIGVGICLCICCIIIVVIIVRQSTKKESYDLDEYLGELTTIPQQKHIEYLKQWEPEKYFKYMKKYIKKLKQNNPKNPTIDKYEKNLEEWSQTPLVISGL